MPANVEIKARLKDFSAMKEKVEALSQQPGQVLTQEDVFFHTSRGRLKLRLINGQQAELIFYDRPDQQGPKFCQYELFTTDQPERLKKVLSAALGERGVVRKIRYFYLAGQTRIHLDRVEGLGDFLELEVVLQPGQTEAEGQTIAFELMKSVGLGSESLVEAAYIDLLEQNKISG
ncbi:MAG: class IV adenylate cyclase [Candidatus Aminicenantes bacterium]|nr:class IV adenylate cyclase [Candidatus Aminicenantes bacterium]